MKNPSNYQQFLEKLFKKLEEFGIEYKDFSIDHIAYRIGNMNLYNQKRSEFEKLGDLVSENIVGEYIVGIIKLKKPFEFRNWSFSVIEIVGFREGNSEESDWEHAEFLTDGKIEDLLEKYKNLDWDKRALEREEFPMLTLKLGENMRAKFPRKPALDEALRIKNLNQTG